MNATLKVATLYDCDTIADYVGIFKKYEPMWRDTLNGCRVLHILQDMYKFNLTYIYDDPEKNLTVVGEPVNNTYTRHCDIDVFARSMSFTFGMLENAYPVHAISTWRFGFILRRPEPLFFTTFYSKPFTRPVWHWLYAMAFTFSILFYLLKRWEFSIVGGWECSLPYETLMVVGGYCQHIPPIDPKLPSRRIAYFIFFVFAYTVYTFYTSNLLSNLVNEKDHGIDLNTLASMDIECVIVDYMMLAISEDFIQRNPNASIIFNKLVRLRTVSVMAGLRAVVTGKVALLSDYTTIYPHLKKTYDNDEVCKLITVDIFSKIKKIFFTSKDFRYKEQFKIGTLRMREAGILHRIVSDSFDEPKCSEDRLIQTNLMQISMPLSILIFTYVVSVMILAGERIYFKKNKVWPYVE